MFTVTEEELRAANNAFRQRDSCAAAGFLLSVTTKKLEKENIVLNDSLGAKNATITKQGKKITNRTKVGVVSVIINIILVTILIL